MQIGILRLIGTTVLAVVATIPFDASAEDTSPQAQEVVLSPEEYRGALRNPLKGFSTSSLRAKHEWATLCRMYIPWNRLENDASDGVEKIREVCDRLWSGAAEQNVKIIPRVYLEWPGPQQFPGSRRPAKQYWPADMTPGDYTSERFKRRVVRLVEKLGKAWDHDPRVAGIQMALIGWWGEHHHPDVSPEMQTLLGDAFTRAFVNKPVMVRHPWDFQAYRFGIHWDSWAHIQQMKTHGAGIERLGDRWKIAPIGGETAYDWGDYKIQPGDDPTDTVRDPEHRRHLINTIRRLHCTYLGWVAGYDATDPVAQAGAEEVQKAFGYRFVLEEVRYPRCLQPGRPFCVSLAVRNEGSAPIYVNWPVELSLLNPQTREPVWQATFPDLDLRRWLPGDRWDSEAQTYRIPAELCRATGIFTAPTALAQGEYILALAILEPAGMRPSARFAVRNYFTGGRHPLGYVGLGVTPARIELTDIVFDDPRNDRTLHYEAK